MLIFRHFDQEAETTQCRPQILNDASLTGPSHPVVVVELLDPPEYDPMFGQ
ncbi:MAG TPA: hypothetical protein VN739_04690 [Nitrososphaerales archaeon]|nr:hypothetical protein [Nitrososphaerales archaeon]